MEILLAQSTRLKAKRNSSVLQSIEKKKKKILPNKATMSASGAASAASCTCACSSSASSSFSRYQPTTSENHLAHHNPARTEPTQLRRFAASKAQTEN